MVPESQELAGRTALVTGGARGIGRAICAALCARGARVIVMGRDSARLEAACKQLRAAGADAQPLVCDLLSTTLEERAEQLGPVDVLVHNAAAFARYAPLEHVPPGEVQRVLDTILGGALRLTRVLLPAMKQRGFGRIVAISTIAAEAGAEGQVAYSTAKAGLTGMIRALAAEGARHGITCNLVQPGLIATERIAENVDASWQRRILASTALGRAGSPGEVAEVVAFLCSPRASYVTGASVPVSGGFGIGLYARE